MELFDEELATFVLTYYLRGDNGTSQLVDVSLVFHFCMQQLLDFSLTVGHDHFVLSLFYGPDPLLPLAEFSVDFDVSVPVAGLGCGYR